MTSAGDALRHREDDARGARCETGYRGGDVRFDARGHAYGSLSRLGIEAPLAGPLSAGIAGQVMAAFDVLEAVEIDIGVQVHATYRFWF